MGGGQVAGHQNAGRAGRGRQGIMVEWEGVCSSPGKGEGTHTGSPWPIPQVVVSPKGNTDTISSKITTTQKGMVGKGGGIKGGWGLQAHV